MNSVQFSNHTGYPTFTGEVLDGAQLEALAKGLDDNGLLRGVSHLLTGYIGSTSFLRAVCAVHRLLKAQNPQLDRMTETMDKQQSRIGKQVRQAPSRTRPPRGLLSLSCAATRTSAAAPPKVEWEADDLHGGQVAGGETSQLAVYFRV